MTSSRVVHWPTANGNWATALTLFASAPQPHSSLPKGVYLRSDDHTLTIFDGYPKAKFHFLVLPRIPFKLPPESTQSSPSSTLPHLGLAGGKLSFGKTASQTHVPSSQLHTLEDLLASPHASLVLSKLQTASEHVVRLIKEEMRATIVKTGEGPCNVEWGVRVGFHAVPSMETVHLHVISDDLVSDRLKHKKHYQSFRPGHGFWLDLQYVQDLVQRGKTRLPRTARHFESLLSAPLVSFRDNEVYSNMVKLKAHLEQAWLADLQARMSRSEPKGNKRRGDSEEEGPIKSQRAADSPPSSETESDK